jgi:hypothetical protein
MITHAHQPNSELSMRQWFVPFMCSLYSEPTSPTNADTPPATQRSLCLFPPPLGQLALWYTVVLVAYPGDHTAPLAALLLV